MQLKLVFRLTKERMIKMTDNAIEVNQKSALGSETTQIAVQHNTTYIGISPEEATQMAITMFREYYPQLKQEALQDVEQMVAEKLKSIPPEKIVPPSPRIAVPTLQNASITEEAEVRAMYATLLANSMNEVVKNGVHPSFVEIIKQLSPDEAKILGHFYIEKSVPTITLRYENDKGEGIDIIRSFSNIGELAGCERPLEINKYFNNLVRLGLIEYAPTLSSLTDKSLYEPLKNHPHIVSMANQIHLQNDKFNMHNYRESYVFLTDFGKSFCKMCVVNLTVVVLPQIS